MFIGNKYKMRADVLTVIIMELAFIPLILYFKVRFITSTLLFFAVPALFLLIRKPKQLKRLGASLAAGMIVAFIVDFLAELNGAWSWAPVGQLIFPHKLFGLIPIDVLIWYFFWLLLTIVYYEHFFEHEISKKVSLTFKRILSAFILLLVAVIAIFYIDPAILTFKYAYFYIGLVGALPFLYAIIKKPRLAGKLVKAGIFNIFVFLSFELTALTLDQWRFPGEYIGNVQLLGLQFPLEEFVFWILLGTPIILSYYELFIDDKK